MASCEPMQGHVIKRKRSKQVNVSYARDISNFNNIPTGTGKQRELQAWLVLTIHAHTCTCLY